MFFPAFTANDVFPTPQTDVDTLSDLNPLIEFLTMEEEQPKAQPDDDLKEAIEACAKVVEEKCRKRPYMIILTKAELGFASAEDQKKGVLKGKTSFMYMAKPTLKDDGVSRILVGASKKALDMAEESLKKND